MNWWKTLTIHKKINAKICFELLCGCKWEELSRIFSIEERINILYNKLKIEGFDIYKGERIDGI